MSKRVDHMEVQPGQEVRVRWRLCEPLFLYVAVEHDGELWAALHESPKQRIGRLSEAVEIRVWLRRRQSFLAPYRKA